MNIEKSFNMTINFGFYWNLFKFAFWMAVSILLALTEISVNVNDNHFDSSNFWINFTKQLLMISAVWCSFGYLQIAWDSRPWKKTVDVVEE